MVAASVVELSQAPAPKLLAPPEPTGPGGAFPRLLRFGGAAKSMTADAALQKARYNLFIL
jgi:hypothetical protein